MRGDVGVESGEGGVDTEVAFTRKPGQFNAEIEVEREGERRKPHPNFNTFSPPPPATLSAPTCPPIHSVKLRTKPTTSLPVFEIKHKGYFCPKLANVQCDSRRTRSSRTRAEGSVGRRMDPPEERVVVIRSVRNEGSVSEGYRRCVGEVESRERNTTTHRVASSPYRPSLH